MKTNPIRSLLLFVYETEGEESVIKLVEEAGLEIGLYKSFFDNLKKELNESTSI